MPAILPYALARKYPNAPKEWIWQYLFPAFARSIDPETKKTKRHHMDPSVLQKAVRQASLLAKIDKPVSPHTARSGHSFATQLLQSGYDTQHLRFWAGVRTIQALLGHKDCLTVPLSLTVSKGAFYSAAASLSKVLSTINS